MCKVIQFKEQKYLLKNMKVQEVTFSDMGRDTEINIMYKGSKSRELVFRVPNKKDTLDTKALSDLYIEIMRTNHEAISGV